MEVDLPLVLFAIHVVVQRGQNVVLKLGQFGVLWLDLLVVLLLVVQGDLHLFLHGGLVGVPSGALEFVLLIEVLVALVGVLWGGPVEMLLTGLGVVLVVVLLG